MRPLSIVATLLLLALLAVAALQSLRWSDQRDMERAWDELLHSRVALPERFDPALVAGLPEPARRYINFAIQPGTPLRTVVRIRMEGELSLGTKDDPGYQPMRAEQMLAAPYGMVWRVEMGRGAMRFAGSDGMAGDRSWTRFWLLGLVPVARACGNADHLRASFGRVAAEAAFWSPAILLPRPGIAWSAIDADTARVTVTHAGMTQDVDIRVDATGQPLWVRMPRWSDANPQKQFRLQPFGGELGDFRWVSGYRVPFRVDAGNFFGTPDYFPFYRARVVELTFQ